MAGAFLCLPVSCGHCLTGAGLVGAANQMRVFSAELVATASPGVEMGQVREIACAVNAFCIVGKFDALHKIYKAYFATIQSFHVSSRSIIDQLSLQYSSSMETRTVKKYGC